MRRLALINPVRIRGHDFFGRRAEVVLEPAGRPGWFWKVAGEDIPITPGLVHAERRRLVLRHGRHVVHVFEHLGALRAMGVDQVRIVPVTAWLPYDGRAVGYWEAVADAVAEDGTLTPMSRRLHEIVRRDDGIPRRLEARLGSGDALTVAVRVSYPQWGECRITRTFPGPDGWDDIIAARSLAKPQWLRGAARLAAAFGWPHHASVLWPQDIAPPMLLEELARHRILDLLGALSALLRPGEYLTGEIDTDLADHAADVALLRLAGSE